MLKIFLGHLQLKLQLKPLSGQFPIVRSCVQKNRKVFARYLAIWERTYMSLNSYNTDNNINNNNNCYYFRKPNMCLTLFYMLSMYYFL